MVAINKIEVWAPVSPVPTNLSTTEPPGLAAPALAAPADACTPLAAKGVFGGFKAYEVDMSVLSTNLKGTLADFQKIMDDLPKSASGYCIDEIELNMGVSGNGGIALIGKFEIGVEAAIKVTIKREASK